MKIKKETIAELITLFIIFIIMCVGIFSSCKPTYEYTNAVQTSTMNSVNFLYNKTQLDSAIFADCLPNDIMNDWVSSSYIDYETNKPIVQYFYYKLNKNNEVTEIYSIIMNVKYDNMYNELYYNSLNNDTIYEYTKSFINY